MSKVKPKQILLVLLILLATLFCGCSTVNVMTVSNEDGTIDEIVQVRLDTKKVMDAGYDLEQTKNQIMIKSKFEADRIVENFNTNVQASLLFATDESQIEKLKSVQNGIAVIGNAWENNRYTIGIRFKNDETYNFYYGITDDMKTEPEEEKHFLYNKYTYTGLTMYIRYSTLTQNLTEYYSENYPDFALENSTRLTYTYITDSRRQHSDADKVSMVDGKYHHTWNIDRNELDKEITLYYNIANRGNCILLCMGISLVVCAVLVTVGVIVDKKKKQKSQMTDVNGDKK